MVGLGQHKSGLGQHKSNDNNKLNNAMQLKTAKEVSAHSQV